MMGRVDAAVSARPVDGQIDHMTVADTALGDDVIRKFLHLRSAAFEYRNFHAGFVIEVHVKCRLREIMVLVVVASQTLGQFARLVIIEIY